MVRRLFRFIKSYRFVIFITFFLVTMLMFFAFGSYLQNSYQKKTMENKIAQVQGQCNILASQVQQNNFLISSNMTNLNTEINQLANVLEGRIIIVDSNYLVIKDTYTMEQGRYLISKDVHEIMIGKTGTKTKTLLQNEYIEILVPILDSTNVPQPITTDSNTKPSVGGSDTKQAKGVIICVFAIGELSDTNEYMRSQADILYGFFIFISFVVAVLMSLILPLPIRALNRKLQHVAEGHLDEPIVLYHSYEEVQDVTDTFNQIISKIQVLESTRQEFVSNVSHELKTPITSMKVLADSLLMQEDVPAEMYREFMGDIAEEIDRENKIITDLLTLVRLDKQVTNLNIETVNINELLELLLKRIQPIAAEREIDIVLESMREVVAEIDSVKLSLAFSNLIENAVKYNQNGGWVHVNLDADHKFFYVKVSDSGVGIPEDCQDKVFERFYRVDKARSRDTGGTGLGLAITRNAILMHKGAIQLYSKQGEGTTFTVRIPLIYIS